VPPLDELPAPYVPFFDGFDADEAAAGQRVAQSLIARFTSPPTSLDDVHEVLITHA
jgi:probable phosphoglycerate mutase